MLSCICETLAPDYAFLCVQVKRIKSMKLTLQETETGL